MLGVMSSPAATTPKARRWYRRPSVKVLLVFVAATIVWLLYGALLNWWDQQALKHYLSGLGTRDPAWRERIYGHPMSNEQIAEHRDSLVLKELRGLNTAAWSPYRTGLYGGMYQDPAKPAALLPEEEAAFLEAAHRHWLPTLNAIEKHGIPRNHRHVDPNESFDKQMERFRSSYAPDLYILNECIEVEVMHQIARNNPAKAIQWMTYTNNPRLGSMYTAISLFERLINLCSLSDAQLVLLQSMLVRKLLYMEDHLLWEMSDEWRLLPALLVELSEANIPTRELIHMCDNLGFIDRKNTLWSLPGIATLRDFYLKLRIKHLFRRPHHLALKSHQVADVLADLQRLPLAQRWPAWKQFAEAERLPYQAWKSQDWRQRREGTEAIPIALFLLRAHYLHDQMIFHLDLHAQLQTTLAAILVERYRLATGRFPSDWKELVPGYAEASLLDPYTGQPLRLKQTDYGIVIYSVGRDGNDEGGQNLSHNHYWIYGGKGFDMKNTNLGTRIYLPHLRRGPAFELEEDKLQSLKGNTADLLKLLKEQTK
jgi:hypothetical protein